MHHGRHPSTVAQEQRKAKEEALVPACTTHPTTGAFVCEKCAATVLIFVSKVDGVKYYVPPPNCKVQPSTPLNIHAGTSRDGSCSRM
jgi:hypothetical protein